MTAGMSALSSGFDSLLAIHGEELSYLAAADIMTNERGEAITDEDQDAILLGNETAETVTGIFEEEFETFNQAAGVATTAPAAFLRTADVPDAARNDMIVRSGVRYYVQSVQRNTPGTTLLILSRDVQ
jgi:hypothetical protein